MRGEHPYVKWAIKVIESKVRDGVEIKPDPASLAKSLFEIKAGVFVTLHTLDGELRGCIGTFVPTTPNLAYEIAQNAIAAALEDPRFESVSIGELDDIVVSVDILSYPEEIESEDELNTQKYGIIVENGWRRGLLLPDLEGVNTVDQQIKIAMSKAGIREYQKIYRFTVQRYH
jgi:AmmeMemoRadiSam system protein A|uniref:AmmeMemoRadiSam system protein A n=1 Tax=Mesoaciditoga lauensis TaxID=1495039 RepID=A0A7V3RF18_9BACT